MEFILIMSASLYCLVAASLCLNVGYLFWEVPGFLFLFFFFLVIGCFAVSSDFGTSIRKSELISFCSTILSPLSQQPYRQSLFPFYRRPDWGLENNVCWFAWVLVVLFAFQRIIDLCNIKILFVSNRHHVHMLSCVWLSATPWTVAHRFLCPWDFPENNTGVGCHFFF